MNIWEVLYALSKDESKIFYIANYNQVATEYDRQVPYHKIGMFGGKVAYTNNEETVRLGYAIVNLCEFEEEIDRNTIQCDLCGMHYKPLEVYHHERFSHAIYCCPKCGNRIRLNCSKDVVNSFWS